MLQHLPHDGEVQDCMWVAMMVKLSRKGTPPLNAPVQVPVHRWHTCHRWQRSQDSMPQLHVSRVSIAVHIKSMQTVPDQSALYTLCHSASQTRCTSSKKACGSEKFAGSRSRE